MNQREAGKECRFFSSKVSPYYNASRDPRTPSYEMTGFECFSSYRLKGDISGHIINVEATEYSNEYGKEKAVDGFSCLGSEHAYGSGAGTNPWVEVEFDSVYPIRKVVVQTRGMATAPTEFENMELRVGDSAGNGDFSSQTFFAYYEGEADPGELVVMERGDPKEGKFLSVAKKIDHHIVIEDMKIFVGK